MSADNDPTQSQPAIASPSDSLDQESVSSEFTPSLSAAAAAQAPPAPNDAGEEATSAEAPRPSERIQIGSQREGAPAAQPKPQQVIPGAGVEQRPAEQQPKRKSYPPPNIRAKLSPELEQELEAALAGGSVEELMSSSVSATRPAVLPYE
jgi:hypothetical protein